MKRMLAYTTCVIGIFSLLSGCTGEDKSDQPVVNSGTVDEEYVGDANIVLKEEYKQTPEEAKTQADILKAIKEEKGSFEGGGLTVN